MKGVKFGLLAIYLFILIIAVSVVRYEITPGLKTTDLLIATNSENKMEKIPALSMQQENYYGTMKVPIIVYHSINDNPIGLEQLSVSIESFAEQMKYLVDNGFTPIGFDDIDKLGYYQKPIIITFDDGYVDNYDNAYPILKMYNIKATIFIITGTINSSACLSQAQIKEMEDLVSFQSHTVNHYELDKASTESILEELSASKACLEKITGKPVFVLSYPCGKYNDEVESIASEYYKYAVTTNYGDYDIGSNNLEISRIYIFRSDSIEYFAEKIKY